MKRYEVTCEWDGYYWVASVDGIPGAFTQAKRLDQVPAHVVEVIKLMTGKTIDANAVDIRHLHVDDEVDPLAEEIATLDREFDQLLHALAQRRRRVAKAMKKRRFPLRDIGVVTHLSHQRVHQLLSE
jgi:predicted RNase H-like HicB family nuclease